MNVNECFVDNEKKNARVEINIKKAMKNTTIVNNETNQKPYVKSEA